ncbi:MAG: FAD-binding oxidoreductase, partial [Pseudomonadota bacterium]
MSQTRVQSLWDRSAAEEEVSSPFVSGGHVDVAVIGGGFTGLSAALHCAEKGLSVHLLEARHIGFGASGRNVGLVNAAAWLPPQKVVKVLGDTYGPRFVEEFGNAPAYVFSLIERHQMRCEPKRMGTIHAAHALSGMRDLTARHAAWQSLGAPVDLLDKNGVGELTGSEHFHGGLLDRRAGTINPMGYCRGLARAARAQGVVISVGVSVDGLSQSGSVWTVTTNHGEITARNVILGTNAYTAGLWPGLEKTFTTIYYFQLSTEPLGERADHILPGGQGLWDTAPVMSSLRRDADGRLLIGSMGKLLGNAAEGASERWGRAMLKRMYPTLGKVTFEEAWDGKIALTPDHMPKIYELADG